MKPSISAMLRLAKFGDLVTADLIKSTVQLAKQSEIHNFYQRSVKMEDGEIWTLTLQRDDGHTPETKASETILGLEEEIEELWDFIDVAYGLLTVSQIISKEWLSAYEASERKAKKPPKRRKKPTG